MTIQWNKNAVKEITASAMRGVARQGQGRLRSVTCLVHKSTHQVDWVTRGEKVEVTVSDPCCAELEKVLQEETEKALR